MFIGSESALCADSRVNRSSASEKQPGLAASEQPARIASLADQARKVRLDGLYQLLSAAGMDEVQEQGYSTLTRSSLDKIFNCLIRTHGFSGESQKQL